MNLTNIILSKRSQIPEDTLHDSLIIEFKIRQNLSVVLEVREGKQCLGDSF